MRISLILPRSVDLAQPGAAHDLPIRSDPLHHQSVGMAVYAGGSALVEPDDLGSGCFVGGKVMGDSAGQIAEMCRAASYDERLADGALYRKAADIIDALVLCLDAHMQLADEYRRLTNANGAAAPEGRRLGGDDVGSCETRLALVSWPDAEAPQRGRGA